MTIREMKPVACSSPHDGFLTVSSCQWQFLKARGHKHHNDTGDHHGNGLHLPRSRYKHSACCVGEHLYVFCGKEGTSPLKDIWKFHVWKQKWEVVGLRGGSLPFLQGHTAVAYKRLILLFGGTFSDCPGDIQLWTYNTDLGHLREVWIELGAAQPLCRRDHSAVIHNNIMYIYGGFVDSAGANQELWAFNIDEEEWTDLTTVSHAHPGKRYSHSAVVADNAMWLYGGMAGLSPRSDLWRYSFLLHRWNKVKTLGSPPPLSGHTASVIHHQMVVVGGNSQGKPGNDVWCFSFDLSPRSMMRPDPLLTHLSHHPDDYFAKGTAEHLTFLRVMREAHREYPFTGKKDADLIQKAVEVVLHRLPVLRQRATQTQHLFYMNTMTRIAKQRKKKAKQN